MKELEIGAELENMEQARAYVTAQLEQAGFAVIHDTNIYDSTYSGAYYRSEDQIDKYMEQYPEIQVILDIHRDAIKQSDGTMVAPTAVIDGKKANTLDEAAYSGRMLGKALAALLENYVVK